MQVASVLYVLDAWAQVCVRVTAHGAKMHKLMKAVVKPCLTSSVITEPAPDSAHKTT